MGKTTEEGAGDREIPEHVAGPGIHTIDMQIKCKFVFFFFPLKNLGSIFVPLTNPGSKSAPSQGNPTPL